MQLLDSIVTGALMLPDERDQKDYLWAAVTYLATGEQPGALRPVAGAMLAANLPALAVSRRRAEAGGRGGRARRKAAAPDQGKGEEAGDGIPYEAIVAHLNAASGMEYRHTAAKTRALIRARWREGYREADFAAVDDAKVAEWGRDPKMRAYIRPETLYGPKFEGYLMQGRGTEVSGGDEYSLL